MQNISLFKRLYYAYLGWAFAMTYRTTRRQFLGYAISSWLKFVAVMLFLGALVLRWGQLAITLALLLVIWVYFSYWRAARQGYNRFVVDTTAVPPADTPSLPPGQRVSLYATGVFAVVDREQSVLLRPAEYWLSSNGEHGVIVNEYDKKYLYQFFRAETLQAVRAGWMIFGRRPLRALAITFLPTWGPDHADDVVTYVVGGGVKENNKGKGRTIYFAFEDTAVEDQVWQTLKNVSGDQVSGVK
ncbi:MAG: hypothetical protein KJ069_17330 [Anaerolineae bacterium]|nr:hypothetical protein [Anaerolineae bacterium]